MDITQLGPYDYIPLRTKVEARRLCNYIATHPEYDWTSSLDIMKMFCEASGPIAIYPYDQSWDMVSDAKNNGGRKFLVDLFTTKTYELWI